MNISRPRPRLASVLAAAVIGALAIGLTGSGTADADKPKPPAPTPTNQPVATLTINPSSGPAISFPISSYQSGAGVAVSSPTGGQRTTSAPSVSEMTVTRSTDSTSPVLFGFLTRGTVLPKVEVAGSLPGGTPFSYELTDVIISGFSSSAGGSSFAEAVSLNFTKIKMTVGDNTTTYDLAQNTTS